MPEGTTIKIPAWASGLGKYVGVVVPMLFAGYLAFHDLQRDFAQEQENLGALEARVVRLEEAKQAREIRDARLDENLTYIRGAIDKLSRSMERLAVE